METSKILIAPNNSSTVIREDNSPDGGIVWLVSYPKSGNTWFRVFLSNLLNDLSEPVDINKLGIPWGISRKQFDRLSGLDSSLLIPAEINALWPQVAARFSSESVISRILKSHGAYQTPGANCFFEAASIDRVIYLVRNPLDVCISFANHSSWSIDHSIDIMSDSTFERCQRNNHWNPSFPERVSSWSGNVASWVYAEGFPVRVIQYEELLNNPIAVFEGAVKFLGLDVSPEQIRQAVTFSDFNALQRQENETEFREKSPNTARFFRQGKAGGWRKVLSKYQSQKLIHDQGDLMEVMNYSTDIL